MRKMIESVLVSAVLASVVACGSDKPAQDPSAMTPPPPPMPESKPATTDAKPIESSMGGDMTADTPPAAPTAPSKPTEKPLTDAEIVAVTSAANTGEIEMAQLASKTAANPDVKNFAAMMVTQHRDLETKGKTLAAKAKITPADNDASRSLKTDVDASLMTLKGQKGKDFDKAYMEAQVKAHRDVLNIIDNKLLPNVQNNELKTMLTDERSHVATHLAKAEEIQQKLESAPAKATKPATTTTKPAPKK
jgi:putative membrane protein